MTDDKSKSTWLTRLRSGLARSSGKVAGEIAGIFRRPLDQQALDELEEALIAADLGPVTAQRLVTEFSLNRFGREVAEDEIKAALAAQIAAILKPYAKPLEIDRGAKPFVILVVGVNGTGKTTTIGKLAQMYAGQGLKVMLAAGDTFRAAAIGQLQIWGARAGAEVIAGPPNGDSAALAFQALERAQAARADVLLIDTAGRLHNKGDLMQELAKLARVVKKLDEAAPHATLLVLDATTGQNAHSQVEAFRDMVNVTGLIVTKLDGSARGGVLVALADKFRLPIHAIGVGEQAEDFQPFAAEDFAQGLMGIAD